MATRGRKKGYKLPEKLEAEKLVKETVDALDEETLFKETGLTKETVERRLSKMTNYPAKTGPMPIVRDDKGPLSVSTLIHKNLEIARLPRIDLKNAEEVEERILRYFEIEESYGNKPTFAGMGVALNGIDRTTLYAIVTGNYGNIMGEYTRLPKNVIDTIKKYHTILTQMWEEYMQSGKINPVSGIFLGKNNYGYRDQVEHVVTPNVQQSDFSANDIRERLGLPDSDTDSDSDGDSD